MKKSLFVLAAAGGLLAAGCGGLIPAQVPSSADVDYADTIRAQAAEELKKVFAGEVEAFFENDDLEKTLGISGDEQEQIRKSIKGYIDSYSMDAKELEKAKESIEQLLESAQGLSAEELQEKITGIFGKTR